MNKSAKKEKKNLLVFGYGLSIIIPTLVFFHGRKHGFSWITGVLLIIALGFFMATLLNYKALKPIYKKWMAVAYIIGSVITGVILSVLFYAVFGLVGLILRLAKKDLLDREINLQATSYWVKREPAPSNLEQYKKQF